MEIIPRLKGQRSLNKHHGAEAEEGDAALLSGADHDAGSALDAKLVGAVRVHEITV